MDTVFARHEDAPEVDDLSPREIRDLRELSPPWCRMDWGRHPAPDQAVHRSD